MGRFAMLARRRSTGDLVKVVRTGNTTATGLLAGVWRLKWWTCTALMLVALGAGAHRFLHRTDASSARAGSCGSQSCPGNGLSSFNFFDLVVADMDRDGRSDLVLAADGSGATAVIILRNPGDSAPVACWPRFDLEASEVSRPRLAVGDLDHDGFLDVVAASFNRRTLRWWLLGSDAIKDSKGLEVHDPEAGGGRDELKLSSLALADVDTDGDLDLAVTGMRLDDEDALTQIYTYGPGNRFTKAREWKSRSAVRTRFVDVGGDGRIELVNSVFSLRHPVSAPVTSGDALVWAEVRPLTGAAPIQLSARFDAPLVSEPPRAAVADFDVLGAGSTQRFALALSSHHCAADHCWDDHTQGGFVQVVNAEGKVLWSSAGAELQGEQQETAEAGKALRFVPSKVRFLDTASTPGMAIGYWRVFPREETCEQRWPCAGPVLVAPSLGQAPSQLGQAAFLIQGFGLLRSASAEPREHCAQPLGTLVNLPDHNIASVEAVVVDQRPLRFNWVPDTDFIQLSELPEAPSSSVCVRYFIGSASETAVVDQNCGPSIVSFN
jgi:hypothetical protein